MQLRQLGFTYRVWGSFTKNKERIQTFNKTGDSRYTYQNKLEKTCFEPDMAYRDFKDLPRKTVSDKYYVIRQSVLLKIQNMMVIKEDLHHWFISFLIKSLQAMLLRVIICKTKN